MCETCPFNDNEESAIAQNYGCLPTPFEIVEMKRSSGHNWACHSDERRICHGLRANCDTSTGDRIVDSRFYHSGSIELSLEPR